MKYSKIVELYEAMGMGTLDAYKADFETALVNKTREFYSNKQDEWIKAQIASGDFPNDSEYIRDLVRRGQEQNAKFQALKQAVQEGLDSGESDKTVTDIMEEVEARLRADGRL